MILPAVFFIVTVEVETTFVVFFIVVDKVVVFFIAVDRVVVVAGFFPEVVNIINPTVKLYK